MIKFKNLLKEGTVSPILYHTTGVTDILSILKENKFRLTPAYGTDTDQQYQKGKLYFLSASRIKHGGYARSVFSSGTVTLELDGKRLGDNYESVNVDYWGDEFRDSAWKSGDIKRFMRYDENEERLITNDPEIEPASKYIKSIHVFVGNSDSSSKRQSKLVQLENMSEDLDVPAYFYVDSENFKTQQTKRAYSSPSKIFGGEVEVGEYEKKTPRVYGSKYGYIEGVIDILQKKEVDNLSEEGNKVYKKFKGGGVPRDFTELLKAEIHNNKSNSEALEKIKVLSKYMKRDEKSSIEGLIDLINKKVKKLEKQDKKRHYKKYKRAVKGILELYNLRNTKNIDFSDFSNAGLIDSVGKYFDYITQGDNIHNFEKNHYTEKALKAVREISNLMELGYFNELKKIVKKETEKDVMSRRLEQFMDNVIQPVIKRMAKNEGIFNNLRK